MQKEKNPKKKTNSKKTKQVPNRKKQIPKRNQKEKQNQKKQESLISAWRQNEVKPHIFKVFLQPQWIKITCWQEKHFHVFVGKVNVK